MTPLLLVEGNEMNRDAISHQDTHPVDLARWIGKIRTRTGTDGAS